jgi:predicted DNA-binding transcriptional regulator AlpA
MARDTKVGSPAPRYLTYPELAAFGVSFSRKHLLDLMRAGKFPQARQMSANRVAWLEAEIIGYLETRPVSRAVLRRK